MKESVTEFLKTKIANMPSKPGCYLWMGKIDTDQQETVLYVGKAINLKNRVRQYLNSDDYKTRFLMNKVTNLDWVVTNNEVEALLLEANLIKQHSPQYNIRLKDDKRYPYLCLTTGEMFPRLIITRNKKNKMHTYFGPYSDPGAARTTLALIHKLFPIRKRDQKLPLKNPTRPCLNYHIGLCLAPCAEKISPEEYGKIVEQVRLFLEGKNDAVLESLHQEMEKYATRFEYEKAAHQRDIISDIRAIYETQHVHKENDKENIDIAGLYYSPYNQLAEKLDLNNFNENIDETPGVILIQIVLLRIRNGNLVNKSSFALSEKLENSDDEKIRDDHLENEIWNSFMRDYYLYLNDIPPAVILSSPFQDQSQWEKLFSSKYKHDVKIETSLRSNLGKANKGLVKMAVNNAEYSLRERVLSETIRNRRFGLRQIQNILKLKVPPAIIECYDISNIQGKYPVGGMVTFKDGLPNRSGYRRFKIRSKDTPDDPAMMFEMLDRRLNPQGTLRGKKKEGLPDLIIIDGGITQLRAAREAAKKHGIDIPMFGLAKREEEIYLESGEVYHPDKNSPGMLILRHARDEVHRYSVTYHRTLRSNTQFKSGLQKIQGIGEKRKKEIVAMVQNLENPERENIDKALEKFTWLSDEQKKNILELFFHNDNEK